MSIGSQEPGPGAGAAPSRADAVPGACDSCLRRSWLLRRLAGHLDRHPDRLDELLALDDGALIAALGGRAQRNLKAEWARFDGDSARRQAERAGLEPVCRCRDSYPEGLRELEAPPAVLHVAGGLDRLCGLLAEPAVAIVGARRPSSYGVDVARSLARRVAAAGVTVISGMARGIDSCAHRGALEADGGTVAVLAGAAELPYPARARTLHAQIRRVGTVVSELPPGTRARRWMFPARNRLIAALSGLCVVVEAQERSGALITARHAVTLNRPVGAVPGRITSPLARGPHRLLRNGARLIEEPTDVLEGLFGAGRRAPSLPERAALEPAQQAVLEALAEGADPEAAIRRADLGAGEGLAALAALELAGRVSRRAGGGYWVRL